MASLGLGFGGKSGALPADVQNRFNQNGLLPRDAQALREHGFEYFAQQCEQAGEQINDLRLQQTGCRRRPQALPRGSEGARRVEQITSRSSSKSTNT